MYLDLDTDEEETGSAKLVCCIDGSNSESSDIKSSTFLGGVWKLFWAGLGEGQVGKEAGGPP